LFPNQATVAYSLVFGCQALGMLLAVYLLSRVDVREFRENSRVAITKVLASDLD
jgi:BCD family chlorophyll transporter-like MFS transporter